MNELEPKANKQEKWEGTVTRELVVTSLREHPEDLTILNAWVDIKQKQIQAPYISREDTEKRTFEFAVELAELYRDAGLREAAWDAYNDAADMAQANGMEEVYQRLLVEMGKI